MAGTRAVIAYDSPQHMIEGDWIETIVVDEAASEAQRRGIESIRSRYNWDRDAEVLREAVNTVMAGRG